MSIELISRDTNATKLAALLAQPMQAVVLDRDGVINQDSDNFIKNPEEWIPLEGSLEAIARLNQAGLDVVVASNQSGIARGLFDLDTLMAIQEKMQRLLAQVGGRVDGIYFCPHGPDDGCDCRKPQAGLYDQIHRRHDIDFSRSWSVGDSLRDLQAAVTAGTRPVLVKTGKGKRTLANGEWPEGTLLFDSLADFVDQLLEAMPSIDWVK